mmetsp:Transcript_301/g.976  ORF Transcript_301/g.976 Transcript_301/m.976 type:complete len:278 (+) Transcript_301:689-1522(+)
MRATRSWTWPASPGATSTPTTQCRTQLPSLAQATSSTFRHSGLPTWSVSTVGPLTSFRSQWLDDRCLPSRCSPTICLRLAFLRRSTPTGLLKNESKLSASSSSSWWRAIAPWFISMRSNTSASCISSDTLDLSPERCSATTEPGTQAPAWTRTWLCPPVCKTMLDAASTSCLTRSSRDALCLSSCPRRSMCCWPTLSKPWLTLSLRRGLHAKNYGVLATLTRLAAQPTTSKKTAEPAEPAGRLTAAYQHGESSIVTALGADAGEQRRPFQEEDRAWL